MELFNVYHHMLDVSGIDVCSVTLAPLFYPFILVFLIVTFIQSPTIAVVLYISHLLHDNAAIHLSHKPIYTCKNTYSSVVRRRPSRYICVHKRTTFTNQYNVSELSILRIKHSCRRNVVTELRDGVP